MPAHGSRLKSWVKCYSYKRFYIFFFRFCFISSLASVYTLERQHIKVGEEASSTQVRHLFNYFSELIEDEYEYSHSDRKCNNVSEIIPTDSKANGNRGRF
jgi:hypothetical protein